MILIASFAFPSLAQRFWRWWCRQLSALVPEPLRRRWPGAARRFVTLSPEGEMEILRQRGPDDPALVPAEGETDTNAEYSLLLPAGQFLQRRIVLPAAARRHLSQVIRFEIDRHTPFEADQVYFDARIAEQSGAKITAEFIAVPKSILERQLEALRQAGLEVDDVAILDQGRPRTGLALLPRSGTSDRPRWPHYLNLILGAVLLALTAIALLLPIQAQQYQIETLQHQLAKARKAAIHASDIQKRLEALQRQRRFLVEKKRQTPATLQLLEELSRRLPQDTWLTQLRYQDGQLRIDGQSPAASKLVEQLENSPYFDNVHFVSPITQDRRSGLERFRISMDIQRETGQASAAE